MKRKYQLDLNMAWIFGYPQPERKVKDVEKTTID